MIDTEFAKQTSLDAVAQAVVDRVKRIHSDTFASGGERAKFCPRHEDMTLLVRNFGYPLGEMSQPTPSPAPGMCVMWTGGHLRQLARAGLGGPAAWSRAGARGLACNRSNLVSLTLKFSELSLFFLFVFCFFLLPVG